MAVAFKTALGTGVSASSGNALAIVTTAAIAIDDLVVIRIAADNLNATTPTISTITDGGNTYTVHKFQGQNATAAAGVVGAIAVTKATVARPSSTSINIGFSGSISNKAAYAESFTGVFNTVRSTAVSAAGATGNAASPASGTVNAGDLVLGAAMVETRTNSTGDTDTTNGSWSTITQIASGTSAGDATRVLASGQYKIATATGAQTYNTTNTSTDWVAMVVVLQADPSVTFDVQNASHGQYASSVSFGVPAEIPDLYQWYDAADASSLVMAGSKVAEWRDKSDNKYFVGAGSTEQPTLVADALKPGRSAIQFATSKWMTGGLNTGANQKPLTCFIAIKHGGTASDRAMVGTNSTNGFMWGLNTAHRQVLNKQYVVNIHNSTTPVTPNVPAILCVSYSATGEARFYLNNVLDGVATNNQTFDAVNPATLIADGIAQGLGDAVIGEVIKYARVLSDAERTQVFDYLNARHVPIPPVDLVVDSCSHTVVSQQPASSYLTPSVGTISTPDAGPPPTECVWVMKVRPTNTLSGNQTYGGQWDTGTVSWSMFQQTGNFFFSLSLDGTTTYLNQYVGGVTGITMPHGVETFLAARIQADYDGTNGRVTLFKSANGTTWTQLSFTSPLKWTALHDSTGPIRVGVRRIGEASPFFGRLYWSEMRTGIDPNAGSVLWRFDANEWVSGTSFVDPRGKTWTLTTAGAITTVGGTDITLEEIPAINLVVQNAQHAIVNQTDFSKFLLPSIGRVTTPDPATMPSTGFVFVMKLRTKGTGGSIVSQDPAANTKSFYLQRASNNTWTFRGYPDGTTNTQIVLGYPVNAAMDLNNPEYLSFSYICTTGAYAGKYSTNGGISYNTYHSQTLSAVALFNSPDLLSIGVQGVSSTPWDDTIWWVECRTGIDPKAGTLLWRFDANDYVSGTGWTDPRGNVWTLTSAAAIVTPVTDTPVIEHVVPIVVTPDNCFHTVVSTSAVEAYISPSASYIASTPDPGPLPNTITFICRVFGPTSGAATNNIASQFSNVAGDCSWMFSRVGPTAAPSGSMINYVSPTGSTSATGPGVAAGATSAPTAVNVETPEWLATSWTRNSSDYRVFTSPDGVVWTQIGSSASGSNLVAWDSSLPVRIGTSNGSTFFTGRIYSVEARDGFSPTTGSVIWRFDAMEHVSGTSWVDKLGRTWTLTDAAAITHVAATPDVVITHIPAVNLVVQDCQHAFVEQNDLNAFLTTNYLGSSYETVTTPDPGPLPTDGFVIVAKALGPVESGARLGLVAQYGNDGNRSYHLERIGSNAAASAKGDVRLTAFPAGTTAGSVSLGDQDTQTVDTVNPEFFATSYNVTTGAWRTLVSTNGGANYAQVASGTAAATGFFDSSDVLRIGALTSGSGRWIGLIYWVELRSGNDPVGGTLLWRFDVNEHVAGLSWVDLRGRTWTSTSSAASFVHPTTTRPTIEVQVAPTLANADSYHTVDSSTPTLTQQHVLTVQNAVHAQIATSPVAASAVRFDNLADAYWRSSTGLSPSSPVTFACWVYLAVDPNIYTTWIGADNGAGDGYLLLGTNFTGTAISFDSAGGNGLVTAVHLTVGQWYYTAGVYDPAGTDTLYYAAAGNSTLTVAASNTNLAPGNPFTTFWVGSDTFTDGFNGRVAQVKAWSAALTKTELEAEMPLNGVARTTDLWGYYSFRSGPQTNDESGNGRTLTAGGTMATEAGPPIGSGGDIALTQTHVLVVASAAHTQVADSPPLTQEHVLAVAGAAHTQAVDHIAINTATNVPAADAAHAIVSDSPAITQLHVLVVANAAHTVVSDNVTTNYVVLAPANTAHAHAVDAPSITQVHVLTVQSATHAHAADAPSITQLHIITVAGATHAHGVDSPSVTQVHILTVQSAVHDHTCPEVSISTEGVVAGADTYHPLISDNVTLTQVHNLTVQNAFHLHLADNATLVYNVNLTVANAAHAHSAGVPTLVYNIFLTVASAAHAHAVENVVLNYVVFVVANAAHAQTVTSPFIIVDIPVLNAAHAHTASNIAITQDHFLAAVADTVHAHSVSGDLLLTQIHKLTADSTDHLQVADEVAFTQDHFLVVADTQHAHDADEDLALTQVHNLAVASAFHAHNTDEVGPIEVTVWLEVWSAWHAHRGEEVNLAGIVKLTDAVALYLGAQVVRAAYVGATKVWP